MPIRCAYDEKAIKKRDLSKGAEGFGRGVAEGSAREGGWGGSVRQALATRPTTRCFPSGPSGIGNNGDRQLALALRVTCGALEGAAVEAVMSG